MRIRSGAQSVAVLNASYEPLGIVTLHRAMVFLMMERAVVVEAVDGQGVQTAGGLTLQLPRVIAFREMVRSPSVYRPMPWSRRALLERDQHRCAYCLERGSTRRPRPAPLARRREHVAEHGRRLQPLQQPQGRSHTRRGRHAAALPAA